MTLSEIIERHEYAESSEFVRDCRGVEFYHKEAHADRAALIEMLTAFGFGTETDAYYNLGGAIIDIERAALTEGGYHCDDICLKTLKRVESQLGRAAMVGKK